MKCVTRRFVNKRIIDTILCRHFAEATEAKSTIPNKKAGPETAPPKIPNEPAVAAVKLPNTKTARTSSDFSKDIDIDRLRDSLLKVNNFSKKKSSEECLLFYEIHSNGVNIYRQMNLREVLDNVNEEARTIDSTKTKTSTKIKHVVKQAINTLFDEVTEAPMDDNHKHNNKHNHRNSDVNQFHKDVNDVYNQGHELSMRDVHRLDYLFNLNEEKAILIRRHAVLFSMDPVRAIVMANRILLLAPSECDPVNEVIAHFMKGMQINLMFNLLL